MRTVFLPDRNCLRHMKKAHVYRALLKRREAEALRRQHNNAGQKETTI